MFAVKAVAKGTCLACGKETECFDVECSKLALSGLLCPTDFRKQVRIATSSGTSGSTSASKPAGGSRT